MPVTCKDPIGIEYAQPQSQGLFTDGSSNGYIFFRNRAALFSTSSEDADIGFYDSIT
jgi:hypothetical protein